MLFKSLVCATTILAATAAFAAPAKPVAKSAPVSKTSSMSSTSFFFKPYVGADYQYTSYGNENFGGGIKSDNVIDTNLGGGNIHVGARIHKNLGLELGYARTAEGHKNTGLATVIGGTVFPIGRTTVDVETLSLDALGYYPLTPKLELIGTVGVAYATMDLSTSTGLSVDESEWQARIGAGAQYWLCDNLNARALVRYQGADFDGAVDGAVVSTVGLNWAF